MHPSIDYYFSLVSPWAYIGHATFMDLTQRHSLDVNFKPVSLPTVLPKPAAFHSTSARQRGSVIELWNCSAGARSAVCD
jgi:2-hydroxychromene-2-carboxylate isomerase